MLSLLPPALFQHCFRAWLRGLCLTNAGDPSPGQRRIAIDGKTLRRSHDQQHGLGLLHLVSAWASDCGVTLGQVATEEKSNEITAIPPLLELLDLADAVAT